PRPRGRRVDIRDVRRLGVTVLAIGVLLLLFLLALYLQRAGTISWGLARAALARMSLAGWLWTGAAVLVVLLGVLAAMLYGVPQPSPVAYTKRQVQCQDCKAVFWLTDTGARPLQHPCPNCKALGIYDGRAPPAGRLPAIRPEQVVELGLTCRTCHTRFTVRDTGVRPLRVTCVKCRAVGTIM
ncbi:MAG TPA: hypothetical protein VFH47_09260, partial [Candidatus Thermoplasmatota archaeon]|nr:hypothetical protein [Candidatus Thermoplasmatota archaeon]